MPFAGFEEIDEGQVNPRNIFVKLLRNLAGGFSGKVFNFSI